MDCFKTFIAERTRWFLHVLQFEKQSEMGIMIAAKDSLFFKIRFKERNIWLFSIFPIFPSKFPIQASSLLDCWQDKIDHFGHFKVKRENEIKKKRSSVIHDNNEASSC